MTEKDRERVIPEAMGGAGGGDLDDMGDVGYPENREIAGQPADQETLQQAQDLIGAEAEDVEVARGMGSGDTGTAPGIPQGDLDREEVANARDTARDVVDPDLAGPKSGMGIDPDTGAPWDNLDEGMRMRPRDEKIDPQRGRS